MSRNRCNRSCDCGLWHFQTEQSIPQLADGLLTIAEYLGGALWRANAKEDDNGGFGYGYGFREDLDGQTFYTWVSPDGTSRANYAVDGFEKRLSAVYWSVDPEQRYRWRKVVCPFCCVAYAGWYRAEPRSKDDGPWFYELYDTSYWSSFNDEPGEEEKAARRPVSAEDLVKAWKTWQYLQTVARNP